MSGVSVYIAPLMKMQFNQGGVPLAGGKLFTYAANTTTKQATYTDATGTVPNTNPIILDSNGQCDCWLVSGEVYKFVLSPPWDSDPPQAPYWTENDISGVNDISQIVVNGSTLAEIFETKVNSVVTSISNLRNLSKTQNNFAFVTGYYASHDGGGGAYQYDASDVTSADNGGTIIVASDGGRWKLQHFGTVALEQFGAKGDGSTDDTTVIGNCITASVTPGVGVAAFKMTASKGRNYKISQTLNFGNGTSAGVSTINGYSLEGAGGAGTPVEVTTPGSPVTFTWAGASGGTMMSVNGPIWGVDLRGFMLNCAGLAGTGLQVAHSINCHYEDILVQQYTGTGIIHTAYSNPAGCVTGSQHNRFKGVHAKYPAGGGCGIMIGNASYGSSPYLDVAQNTYEACDWWRDGTDAATFSLGIQFADVNTCIQCQTIASGGNLGIGLFVNPPSGNTGFPDAWTFINCDISGGANDPGTWTPTKGFSFFPYPTGDGEPVPFGPSLYDYHGFTDLGELFGGLAIGQGNPRISQHLSVTQSLGFNSNIPPQSSSSLNVSVPGAAVGDTVVVTNNSGAFPAGFILQGVVNTANNVLVSWTNASSAGGTPGTATYRVDVWKH